jgi:hypothetical protein
MRQRKIDYDNDNDHDHEVLSGIFPEHWLRRGKLKPDLSP